MGAAPAPGALDLSFDPGTGANGYVAGSLVRNLVLESGTTRKRADGSIILVGDITSFNGLNRAYVARVRSDGSLNEDTKYPGLYFYQPVRMRTIVELADGSFFLGGSTGTYTDLAPPCRDGIGPPQPCAQHRQVSDCMLRVAETSATSAVSLDRAGPFASGGLVLALRLDSDGSSLFVGGEFDYLGRGNWTTNDQPFHNFGRLRFSEGVGWVGDYNFNRRAPLLNGRVETIIRQPDGKILLGGQFTDPKSYIIRLQPDGSLDNSFNPQAPDFFVRSIAVQSDGRILAGGVFGTQDGGVRLRNHIVRLLADGQLDRTFKPGSGSDGSINAMALQKDGKILIAGEFTQLNGVSKPRLARLLSDGSLDSSFTTIVNDTVSAVVLQPDGAILIGGAFTFVNGVSRNGIARLIGDSGVAQTPITLGITTHPQSQTVTSGGSVTLTADAAGTAPLSYQWQKNGVNRPGATGASLTLFPVEASDAGNYTVVVSNPAGSVTSIPAILNVSAAELKPTTAGRAVQLTPSTGSAGSTVAIPIKLVASGEINSISFSLAFSSTQASFGGVASASGSSGASFVVNTNEAANAQAKIGVVISLPVNQTIPASVQAQPLATLTLQIAAGLPVGTVIPVQFTNSPASKSASDTLGNDVAVTFTDGSITVVAAGYEADVAPRPNGNGSITAADLTVMGRIVAGLDSAPTGAEFQRADCAPRSSLGNGIINAGDLTQLARYVAGLDPQTPVGGPIAPANGVASASGSPGAVARKNAATRRISVVQDKDNTPGTVTALIQAVAQGNENALSFSIAFDTASLTYTAATLGASASAASLVLNTNRVTAGLLGIVLSLPPNQGLLSESLDVLRVRFHAATSAATSAVRFSNAPAPTFVSDLLGNELAFQFVDGTLQLGISLLPVIRDIRVSGATLSANLTGFAAGATVILQTSRDLRHWTDVQTFTASTGSISIQRPVQPNATAQYLRFLVP